MDYAVVNTLKDKIEFGTNEIRKKIPNINGLRKVTENDFLQEMYDFRECETDYLVVLAEQALERIAVALSNKTGSLIFVYKLDDGFIVLYRNEKFWKWELTNSIDDAIEVISMSERSYN